MNPQRRLISVTTDQISVGNEEFNTLNLDESASVNLHGLHTCFSIEPENGDANANGFWVVYCLPSQVITATSDLPQSVASLNSDEYNAYVWGIGCWTASNQAPFHYEFAPRTSRTCQKGARIVLQILVEGVSAGLVRINTTQTGFTTQ